MILNLVGFQVCWLGLIYWGNSFTPIALLMITAHFFFLSNKPHELLLVVCVTIIGCCVDMILALTGIFVFENTPFIPFWLMVLWVCFSSTISHSLQFLKSSIKLQIFVGAVIAPLSYIGGFKFDMVDFTYSLFTTYAVLSLIWSIFMVIIFKLETLFIRLESKYA
jgi:hypothetical protein